MAKFFLGKIVVADFTIDLDNGRSALKCSISEYWSPIINDSAKCGATLTYELSKKSGIRETERLAFEGAIESSIGMKNIAQIKAAAKQNLSSEVYWESIQEEKRTVVFPSPECGEYTALQYQKLRSYDFVFQQEGWFNKNSWESQFTEYTKQYHDNSRSIDPTPDCGCQPKNPDNFDGMMHVDFGETSFLVPFRRTDAGIELILNGKVEAIETTGDSPFMIDISIDCIPESLKFLGEMDNASYSATASPYSEEDIAVTISPVYEVEVIGVPFPSEGMLDVEPSPVNPAHVQSAKLPAD